jgi:hypothetical protein
VAVSASAIRVLVVDDSAPVRHWLRALFATEDRTPRMEIVGETASVAAAMQETRRSDVNKTAQPCHGGDFSARPASRARLPFIPS